MSRSARERQRDPFAIDPFAAAAQARRMVAVPRCKEHQHASALAAVKADGRAQKLARSLRRVDVNVVVHA